MPANWLPIEDWLANVLQEREDVREAVVSTDGRRVDIMLQDGRPSRITIRNPTMDVPAVSHGPARYTTLGEYETPPTFDVEDE